MAAMVEGSMSVDERVSILLVDDQPGKLLSYETILEDLGENLITAGSATEALEQLLRHDVAVVLVDVCMPDLDGFELAAMIREHPRYQKTSILFVSAVHLTELDRLRGYELRRGRLHTGPDRSRDPARQGRRLRRALPQDRPARAAQPRAREPRPRAHRRARGLDRPPARERGAAARGRPPQG